METPNKNQISCIYLEATCSGITMTKWEQLMENATRANKQKIDAIVKEYLPELFDSLTLNLFNPYEYFKTRTHLVLVHSSIEYFLRFEL